MQAQRSHAAATPPTSAEKVPRSGRPEGLQRLPATEFRRLTEQEFGSPGISAIETVGPFVITPVVGPFMTIHDAWMEPGMGIGHHPHVFNERLFYMLSGEIHHDDARNGITGVMREGDLARLTEGTRGMVHREWNGSASEPNHSFILVYQPDVTPPIRRAAFALLPSDSVPVVAEAPGVSTRQLIGDSSTFTAQSRAVRSLFDTTLAAGAALELAVPAGEGLILHPISGVLHVERTDAGATERGLREVNLPATSSVFPEGPDAVAILWPEESERTLRLSAIGDGAGDEAARVIRLGFTRATGYAARMAGYRD
jgi:redox-sensitive bicupin YhaK (pirin superfamily)